ncbi:MAG: DNA-protecting protein DprA [Deltaproteobacteria bacterium]|nr:DNA-protecting protein DprA [Deltaproteobacteria bacterium]
MNASAERVPSTALRFSSPSSLYSPSPRQVPSRCVIAAPDSSDPDFGRGDAPAGLAPEEALGWIAVQRRLAFVPERIRDRLEAGEKPASILRCPPPLPPGLAAARSPAPAQDVLTLVRIGARVLPFGHADYPARLAALSDAPSVLLVRGELRALSGAAVAIVGARAATRSARTQARRFARALAARGITIVSGLARGIDAEAHRGALEAGGRSVGVLACGLDRIYPPEHRALADELAVDGAVVSEVPLGTSPRRELFPLRNRIISGLCRGVIVVEARRRSGSLITVRHALDQGRDVFVVPGPSEGPFAEGSNRLLREGAIAVTGPEDVLEDLGVREAFGEAGAFEGAKGEKSTRAGGKSAGLDPLAMRLLEALDGGPCSREQLLAAVDAAPGAMAASLLDLELSGRIREERDGRIHRV